MGVELYIFQYYIEVRWFSIGFVIFRIMEQWDVICQFIRDLGKNEKIVFKSINYKWVVVMFIEGELKFCLNF